MRRLLPLIVLALLAACGSSGTKAGDTGATTSHEPVLTVGALPSKSSKMVCGEAKSDIAATLAVKAPHVTPPTWIDDVYSCTYVYPDGSFTLSVKEVNGLPAAARYFDGLKTQLGVKRVADLPELGEGDFVTPAGNLIVRKDNKVLTVDVTHLPAEFGPDKQAPSDVAIAVGGVIMGCWTGA